MGQYTEDKILICISSVMVWSNTPPKEKSEENKEEDVDEDVVSKHKNAEK